MSIKPVCQTDKEHNTSLNDKFCSTCGDRLKFQSIKCNQCKHAEYPTREPIKFCPKCGSSAVHLITTETQEDY